MKRSLYCRSRQFLTTKKTHTTFQAYDITNPNITSKSCFDQIFRPILFFIRTFCYCCEVKLNYGPLKGGIFRAGRAAAEITERRPPPLPTHLELLSDVSTLTAKAGSAAMTNIPRFTITIAL